MFPWLLALILFLSSFEAKEARALPSLQECLQALLSLADEQPTLEDPAALAKKIFNSSRHASERLLAHPKYGPLFRRLLEIGVWVHSREAKQVNQVLAQKIAEDEARRAALIGERITQALPLDKMLENIFVPYDLPPEEEDLPVVSAKERRDAIRGLDEYNRRVEQELRDAMEKPSYAQLMQESVQEVLSRPHGKVEGYNEGFAPLLMGSYTEQPEQLVAASQIIAFCDLYTTISTLRKRTEESIEAIFKSLGAQRTLRVLSPAVTAKFAVAGYPPLKKNQLGIFKFALHVLRHPVRERILARYLTRSQIESELTSILKEYISPVNLGADEKDASQYARDYILGLLKDYLPSKRAPINETTIQNHQLRILKALVNFMNESIMKEEQAAALFVEPAPQREQATRSKTRTERIQAYLAEKQKKETDDLTQVLFSPEQTGQERVDTNIDLVAEIATNAVTGLTETEFEQLVARHSATASEAEEILSFFDTPKMEADRENAQRDLAELLLSHDRRLSSLRQKAWSYIPIHQLYELRISGKQQPIRIYFQIDSSRGIILLGAHYKLSDSDQRRELGKMAKRWRAYLAGK